MTYRKEIDGLRALAVLPVILFHGGFHTFSGGFVGVDVFFVISGYLITSILLSELSQGTFSLVGFYERRARRILPALFFVILAIFPFAWYWLLPQDMQSFSQSLIAVSLFASNILFWATSGYFDTAAEIKPLLHTWSLAVEEQYYVFFPLFLLLAWRWGKRTIVTLLAIVALISLLLADWGATHKPMATFYLLPTRGWELLIGAMCSLYLSRQRLPALPARYGEALGALGLGLLCIAVFLFTPQTPFPSLYALVPTLGTALIILFAGPHNATGRVLSTPWLVGIGLVSYSAYLWHQPLFALAKHRSIDMPAQTTIAGLMLLSFLLAYVSWRFVETPFRNKQQFSRRQIFNMAVAGSLAIALLGLAGHLTQGFAFRNPLFQSMLAIHTVENSPCHTHGRRSAVQIEQGDICTLGSDIPPTVAVIGDSHAGALFEALKQAGQQQKFAFYAFSGGFCVPIEDFRLSAYQTPDCIETTRQAYAAIIRNPDIHTVVLAAEWANYTEGNRDDGSGIEHPAVLVADKFGQAVTTDQNKAIFARALTASVYTLQAAGKAVMIVKPVPEFNRRVMDTLFKIRLFGESSAWTPTISKQQYLARNANVLAVFQQIPHVDFIESASLFCHDNLCNSVDNLGRPLFSDSNHVSEYGAGLIATDIASRLHPQ